MTEEKASMTLEKCPICQSRKVKVVEGENDSFVIHCSGCHFTFLPKDSWDKEEMIRRFNTRNEPSIWGEGDEDDDIEELLAQCLRFREGFGSNTSLYPLEE